MNELGKYLKRLRGNMSLREASKRTGISFSYIGYLESGKHPRTGAPIKPSPEMLKGIAKGYNHPYNDLMVVAGYSDDEKKDSSIEETELKKEKAYYANLIASIEDPVKKEQAIAFLKFLANSPTDGAKK